MTDPLTAEETLAQRAREFHAHARSAANPPAAHAYLHCAQILDADYVRVALAALKPQLAQRYGLHAEQAEQNGGVR